MGIQSRDYYRKSGNSALADWGIYQMTPVVKYLIIVNVIVWVLQTVWTHDSRLSMLDNMRRVDPRLDKFLQEHGDDPEALEKFKKKHPEYAHLLEQDDDDDGWNPYREKASYVQEWCELDTKKVARQGQIWRVLTHAFCHDRHSFFHVLFNMLFLYWFGCTLESMYGSREFLLFYLAAAVIAGLAFVSLDLYTGSSIPGIGASGAVMAVTMLYAMHFPRETICIFWLIPIEMRWLMLLFIIWDLHPVLLALGGDQMFTGIAHAAHLGGLAFGFAYGKSPWRLENLGGLIAAGSRRKPSAGARARKPAASMTDRPPLRLVAEPEPDPEMEQVDEILDKISRSGQDSLNDDERALLRRASERLKNRPR